MSFYEKLFILWLLLYTLGWHLAELNIERFTFSLDFLYSARIFWMSARDLALVSTTTKYEKKIPTTLNPPNIQKVAAIPIALRMGPNVPVTAKANIQAKAPVMGLAIALYSFE